MRKDTIDKDGGRSDAYFDKEPDECPICNRAICAVGYMSFVNKEVDIGKIGLQIIYRCPRGERQSLFIAYYVVASPSNRQYFLRHTKPHNNKSRKFAEPVEAISAAFCEIYNQASFAEQSEWLQIAGVGYRKALEFLIKDYLIKIKPQEKAGIESKNLGVCISQDVDNEKIKTVAKRAAWLGNDETHYLRKWVDHDLTDLKKLIDLVVHWIEMEDLTASIEKDMPDGAAVK